MKCWSLLWLTDLHYSLPSANFIDDPKELDEPAFRESVFRNLDRVLRDGWEPKSFDVIGIGGDITSHGKEDGFQSFVSEALPLIQPLSDKSESICIVPGNHDVTWGLNPATPGSFTDKFASFDKAVKASGATSCLLPEGQLDGGLHGKLDLRCPPHGPIYLDRRRKILVLCINSAIRCGELNTRMEKQVAELAKAALQSVVVCTSNNVTSDSVLDELRRAKHTLDDLNENIPKFLIRDVAHVGQAQLNELADRLTTCQNELGSEWEDYLRIAVLHHHLIHFQGQITEHKSYELLLDSAQVLSLLIDFDFDLVLTGHKHQPYQEKYRTGGKDLLIVGGPTVGGHSAGDSFRGVRWIEVEDRPDLRLFTITDIPHTAGTGNVRKKVEEYKENSRRISCSKWEQTGAKTLDVGGKIELSRRIKRAGLFYREISSITLLDEDGDARRIVECEDLTIERDISERSVRQEITLPPTSGYLDQLKAQGKGNGFTVHVDKAIPRDEMLKNFKSKLTFDRPIGTPLPASYSYSWYAVNSFAMDARQFDFMYGRDPEKLNDTEFTHFTTEDPVQELTVIVQFPEGFRPKIAPRLRIARVNRSVSDSRQWIIDTMTENELENNHALHYYESLNTAALRVRYPRADLSYGIQWGVPDLVAAQNDGHANEMEAVRTRLQSNPPGPAERESLLRVLTRIMIAARTSLLSNWQGPFECSLMVFDKTHDLPVLIAAREEKSAAGEYEAKEVRYSGKLSYGLGVAGRAFKTNRIRVYVSPGADDRDQPDYFVRLAGTTDQKVLISFPVCTPEASEVVERKPGTYQSRVPYGILNLGSDRLDCPLSGFSLPDRVPLAARFQHRLNMVLFQALTEILLP